MARPVKYEHKSAMVGAAYEFEPHQFFLVAEDDDALIAR